MRFARTLLTLAVCLLLVLTGQAMAFAKGQSPATGQMVICAGHGSFIIYTDVDGQPTSPPQLCSDCLNLLAATLPDNTYVSPVHLYVSRVHVALIAQASGDLSHVDYAARAPPVL